MKYLLIPIHLLQFWYPEAVVTFIRAWKNLILYLEEDLAVGLMLKLLFVPLFHDASIIGRVLSVIFRVIRIFLGLFAFGLASVLVLATATAWFLLPVLSLMGLFTDTLNLIFRLIFLGGTFLFLLHLITHPHKATWQVGPSKGSTDLWSCSWISKKNLKYSKMLRNIEVKFLLDLLETDLQNFTQFDLLDLDLTAERAFDLAKAAGSKYIEPVHFFVACLKLTPDIENYLLKLNLTIDDFEKALIFLEMREHGKRPVFLWDSDFAIHHLKGVNRGWLGAPTPVLDSVSEDLTKTALKTGYANFVGRSAKVSELINVLSEESRSDVVIVGAPGSGKTSLIDYLAKQIIKGDAPEALATKRLVSMDLTKLLSGMRTQGDLADRLKEIFDEVNLSQNVIIVVEEIHNLGIGEAGVNMNLYSLLSPYIERANSQFIGTTEPENYTRIIEKNGAFARLFTKIELPPATESDSIEILENRAIEIEKKRKIRTTYIAIKKTVELSDRLIKNRVLPDSAIATLDEAVTLASEGWINYKTIKTVLTRRSNIPVTELGAEGNKRLLDLENLIHQKLIDQEQAVKAVSDSLRRSATGLREQNRPIGSFLFVGPTGVGKTELAKILSEVYFQGSGAFIRFDMSEYQNPESVNRLIGDSVNAGQLTEAVRNKPYALLLLDEFEKADPKILTLFLQVLDDGRLTDGYGRTVDFTNTIIIATSNAASLTIAQGLRQGKTLESLDNQVQAELLQVFRPELINRFDDIILFNPLSNEDLQKIVVLKLAALQKQLKDQGYLVKFSDQLISELARKGFDPVLGARPLRRLIQDSLEADLSKMILENKLMKGTPVSIGVNSLV